jgi:hypothetical protein
MNEINPEQKKTIKDGLEVLGRTLKQASLDSFLLALVFASWGLANLFNESYLIVALGGLQFLLSYANVMQGLARRKMASLIDQPLE